MKNLSKILILGVSALLVNTIVFTQNTQTILSEYWNGPSGQIEAPIFSTVVTKTDDLMNVYVAGATLDPNTNKLDLMIQKFNRKGNLLWERTYGGALNMDDMAADVFIDNNYDVYVTGAVAEDSQKFYDLVVIKYTSNGQFVWDYFYNYGGSPSPYDAGTAITGDNDGHIYVTGSSAGNNTNSDYVIIKLVAESANEVWVRRYDYDGFDDIPAKIKLIANNTKVVVSGGSQIDDSPVTWEMAMIVMDSANQAFDEHRTGQSVTSGVSEVYDMTTDANDNIYIVGTKKNTTTDYDITVYKLDDELNLIWEETYDGYGEDDRGKGIKVDDQGNVYVAGYVTTLNEGKNYSLLKFDSNGNLDWTREYNGMASQDDEAIQLVITDGSKIVVTGSVVHGSSSDFVTLVYDENGEIINEISFDGAAGLNDSPTNMAIDLEGNIIVVGQTQTGGSNYDNVTVKYTLHEKPQTSIFDNDIPYRVDKQVIIHFDTSAINRTRIDERNFRAGRLEDFVKPYVIDSLNEHLDFETSQLQTFKIFTRLTTADSLSLTRLGDTIRMPEYWSWLKVVLPEKEDDEVVLDSLNNMNDSIVKWAEFNFLYTPDSNDPLLQSNEQSSLVYNTAFPDEPHINAENAWAIETGKDYVKVGVFDAVIHWAHEDFGDGTFAGSKITGGWDFHNNMSINNQTDVLSNHGTAVAGIIGAIRNNGTGIAGIAGGDWDNDQNSGVQLFSMAISKPAIDPFTGDTLSYVINLDAAIEAIVEGAANSPNFGYGLHVQNHSWGSETGSVALNSAVETAWRHHSVFIASRGNDGDDVPKYPACYADEQVISVMANGDDKNLAHENNNNTVPLMNSSYGGGADMMAPGITSLVTTTTSPDYIYDYSAVDNCTSSLHPDYQCFFGTSASAPHVSGVAALMYSKHNTINGAPNNLATEDIEKILEKTAHGFPSYQAEGGWGLINAGDALEAVNYPEYFVKHSANTSASISSLGTDLSVIVAIPTDGVAAGNYNADKYLLEFTYVDILSSNMEIIDWWTVKSRTFEGVSHVNPITGVRWMTVAPNITIGGNTATVQVSTVAWLIKNSGIQVVNKWIPSYGLAQIQYAYSLHVRDNTLSENEQTKQYDMYIYPNPTDEQLTISIDLENASDLRLEVYDMQGSLVASPELGHRAAGNHSFVINTYHLNRGVYIIRLYEGNNVITKKFIRQ